MLSIAPHISWNPVEGELALFDARTGAYHALNGSAAVIWRAIAQGRSPAETVESLVAIYTAPEETIAASVRDFIAEALARGLLVEDIA